MNASGIVWIVSHFIWGSLLGALFIAQARTPDELPYGVYESALVRPVYGLYILCCLFSSMMLLVKRRIGWYLVQFTLVLSTLFFSILVCGYVLDAFNPSPLGFNILLLGIALVLNILWFWQFRYHKARYGIDKTFLDSNLASTIWWIGNLVIFISFGLQFIEFFLSEYSPHLQILELSPIDRLDFRIASFIYIPMLLAGSIAMIVDKRVGWVLSFLILAASTFLTLSMIIFWMNTIANVIMIVVVQCINVGWCIYFIVARKNFGIGGHKIPKK